MKGISVIIPTYNREQFIAEAIESVINQEYIGDIEIVIADDGSTDRTLEIAQSYSDKVTILRKSANCLTQGVSTTRNRGIKASTQPYICFLDSDDFFLPGHLKKISVAIESKENLGFAFCRILEIKEEEGSRLFKAWTKPSITTKDIINPAVSGNNVVCSNVFIFQRYVFDTVGMFNETFKNGEDSDMWMRISERYKGAFADHFGAVRRKHEFYQLTSRPKRAIHKYYLKVYEEAIKRYYHLGLKNFFRIYRLRALVFKYKLSQLKFLSNFYGFYFKRKDNPNKKLNDWYELSYFLTDRSVEHQYI